MFDSGDEVLLLLILLRIFEVLLRRSVLVGVGVSIHDTHVVNTLRLLCLEVSDEEILLQIPRIL